MDNPEKINVGKRISKNASEGKSSARWDARLNLTFIELCEEEIGKGNRPNSHFNTNGWKNLVKRFHEVTGREYVYKQLRNHWDSMKKDWILFKKLMHKETGIGWNPLKNSLEASDEWWDQKIKENADYNKFRNKDLSLIWFRYDKLFSDVAATGERARAPNQRVENEIDSTQEFFSYNGELNETEQVEVGYTDDNNYTELDEYSTNPEVNEASNVVKETMFPNFTVGKRKASGENTLGKKKLSGAASLKEDIRSLLEFVEKKNAARPTSSDITVAAALDMLSKVPGVTPSTELWFYACNLLSKKEMREVFVNQPSDECRLRWLEYNHKAFQKNN